METGEGAIPQASDRSALINKKIALENGENISLPAVHVSKMLLFHGSPVSEITTLEEGDQLTIGRGVYLTPNRNAAQGYALKRSNDGAKPVVYQAEISNLDLVDLRTRAAQKQFAKLFSQALLNWGKNVLPNLKGQPKDVLQIIKKQRKEAVADLVEKIDTNSWIQLRDLTFGWADLVTRTLSANGYKGLISVEGEPPAIDFHDSVVIFNPQDVAVIGEHEATTRMVA